ncbi:MFS transporter [Couchioplanes caeruleus]|uniref:MFS transporter n=1 Tax=Couchioplanes caeruleus TaxID=56438 RepID=UPI0020BEF4E4|nr:MFS transporter [Couchioplanes caeruleus]UQU68175.1 MFS transporter [Couchioplanes caeruleus]
MTLGPDFRRLWSAYAVSELGTALSLGALPLIATLVLHASVLQVSLLAALGGLAGAALALPLGPWIEFRPKRPVMAGADLVRGAALASVPVAAAAGVLTYAQLCLVAVAQSVGVIAFQAASGAHLKGLVPAAGLTTATGRFEATFWTVNTVGPPLGGALVGWLGPTATMAADAVSFLLSAVGVRSLRSPEPAPPERSPAPDRWAAITAGWRYILGHPELRALYANSLIFNGGVMATLPLITVLMLRELGFAAWAYGLVFGVSCLGGLAGSLAARPLVRRRGRRRVLLVAGVAKTLPLALVPFAPAGTAGLVLITAGELLTTGLAGLFNPAFAAWRLTAVADRHVSRVLAAWSISNRVAQPVCITGGGLLAAATSVRAALLVITVGLAAGAALLPWRPVPVSAVPAAPRRSPAGPAG